MTLRDRQRKMGLLRIDNTLFSLLPFALPAQAIPLIRLVDPTHGWAVSATTKESSSRYLRGRLLGCYEQVVQVNGFHGEAGNLKVAQLPVTLVKLRRQQHNQVAFSV